MNLPTEGAPEGFKHAWYSPKQETRSGSCIYVTNKGVELLISEVRASYEPSNFEDATYLGLVLCYTRGGYVRKAKHGYRY